MQVRPLCAADIPAVYQLLAANGWAHRLGSEPQFADLIAASQRTVVAVEGEAIVGFARAITDGISNGYLSMVVVASSHRRRGIGQALVQAIVNANSGITWVLRAGRDGAAEFFAKLGFKPSEIAMELARGRGG